MQKEILGHLHNDMLIIYKEIARICDAHSLTYFVVGGTLLGAVVHKNFIPWDDDLDVAMPREDYEKFIKICQTELGERFFLHYIGSDKKYWVPFAKLRLKNTVFLEEKRKNVKAASGIYVDIFPFDYACSEDLSKRAIRKWKIINYINNYIYTKITKRKVHSKSARILNPLFSLFTVKALSKIRDRVIKSFDRGERLFFLDSGGGRSLDNSYFNVENILPVNELPFGEISVKVPQNPDSYLLQLYTEKYKIIPPKEKQITHDPLYIKFEDGKEYKNENQ